MTRNVLFIMADQLRRDHLGCYGHPYLRTPHIDALARRGVRFDQAHVNSGVCGPARMSFYTGRYLASHGATWNRVPLSIGEVTLGEYLRDAGRRLALAGKTHVMPDRDGLVHCSSAVASMRSIDTMAITPPVARAATRRSCAPTAMLVTIRGRTSSSPAWTPKAALSAAGTCAMSTCRPGFAKSTRKRPT